MTIVPPDTTALEELAELLVHLGRAAHCEGQETCLTPAKWTALRFFARANRASRTPSALAGFQATTRGTASQTIKALERDGLLTRHSAEHDGRSVRFDITARGRAMLERDPLGHLMEALAGLSAADRASLSRALPSLASQLAEVRGARGFGSCGQCRYFEDQDGTAFCACAGRGLAPGELTQLCASFRAVPVTQARDRS